MSPEGEPQFDPFLAMRAQIDQMLEGWKQLCDVFEQQRAELLRRGFDPAVAGRLVADNWHLMTHGPPQEEHEL